MRPSGTDNYRADVDGLRAIAVLLVVGFHAFPAIVGGGFIGVNVFFVISGFLISSLIFADMEKGRFNLLNFYARRILRIFPALIVTLVTALGLGWFLQLPEAYAQLGKHVAGGALFVSNFLLWGESGYFDAAATTKPLLHLWSLAIEEQFYLFYPALLLLVPKTRFARSLLIGGAAALSLALSMSLQATDPVAAFYSPLARLWELMAGGVLALYRGPRTSNRSFPPWLLDTMSVVGMIVILIGVLLLAEGEGLPAGWALLPVAGTVVVIAAGPGAVVNRLLLSQRPLVWVGLISYPLYLWHWVLLTFLRIGALGAPSPGQTIGAVCLSLALSFLTYRLLETRVRRGGHLSAKSAALAASMLVCLAAGTVVFHSAGFPQRLSDKAQFAAFFENSLPELHYMETSGVFRMYRNDCNFYDMEAYRRSADTMIPVPSISPSCTTADPAKTSRVLLWGDSHAQQLYFGLKETLPANWQVMIVASSGCVANSDQRSDSPTNYCERSNWVAMNVVRSSKPDVVVIAQSREHDAAKLAAIADDVRAVGARKVIIVGPNPVWVAPLPELILRKYWEVTPQRISDFDVAVSELDGQLKSGWPKAAGTTYFSLTDVLCNPAGCLAFLGDDRMRGITSYDVSHLTLPASLYVAEHGLRDAVVSP